jgi:hypothetical protein
MEREWGRRAALMVTVDPKGKVRWRPEGGTSRRQLLPAVRICKRSEAMEFLGQQVFKDACEAGWLTACAVKPGKTDKKAAAVIYRVADLQAVEDRIARGEYPSVKDTERGDAETRRGSKRQLKQPVLGEEVLS